MDTSTTPASSLITLIWRPGHHRISDYRRQKPAHLLLISYRAARDQDSLHEGEIAGEHLVTRDAQSFGGEPMHVTSGHESRYGEGEKGRRGALAEETVAWVDVGDFYSAMGNGVISSVHINTDTTGEHVPTSLRCQ